MVFMKRNDVRKSLTIGDVGLYFTTTLASYSTTVCCSIFHVEKRCGYDGVDG